MESDEESITQEPKATVQAVQQVEHVPTEEIIPELEEDTSHTAEHSDNGMLKHYSMIQY